MTEIRSKENYKIFLENEARMAGVFGVAHLCYVRRSNQDIPPFHVLPSVTTLVECIRTLNAYIEGKTQKLPSQKTFHKITEFFKQAYQLSEPSVINERTLFEYHMKDILEQQGQTELRKFEGSFMEIKNWYAGSYFCYYEQYSASDEFNGKSDLIEVRGAILDVFETKSHSYDAVMITGFSNKEAMKKAAESIWIAKSGGAYQPGDITNIFSTYKNYLEDIKSSKEKTIYFWSGKIEEQRNQIHGKFHRQHSGDIDIDNQELLLSLFKHSKSKYDHCQGGIGVMVKIIPNEEIGSSKFILSTKALDLGKISNFLEKKRKRLSFLRSDDRDFLNIILASEESSAK